MKLYYIDTQNGFGQILVFTSRNRARNWLKKATVWDDEKIEKNIFEAERNWLGCFDVFPIQSN